MKIIKTLFMALALTGSFFFMGPDMVSAKDALPVSRSLDEMNSLFKRGEGFLGGDGFYTVSLSPERTLVIFGDTLTGSVEGGKRKIDGMPNNTIAMLYKNTGNKNFGVRFFLDDKMAPFLKNSDPGRFFWPLDGILSGGRLYLFGAQIKKTSDSDAFGFKECGNHIFVIDNPDDPPRLWKKSILNVPHAKFSGKSYIIWGSSLLSKDGYIYIYGVYSDGVEKWLVTARAAEEGLCDFNSWEFYSGGGFHKKLPPSLLLKGISNEFSVLSLPSDASVRLIYTKNSMGADIVMRSSASPVFKEKDLARVIYSCPENGLTKNIFTYSAKAVKALCARGRIVLVYFSNSFDVSDPINDLRIYWPRFVEVLIE